MLVWLDEDGCFFPVGSGIEHLNFLKKYCLKFNMNVVRLDFLGQWTSLLMLKQTITIQ